MNLGLAALVRRHVEAENAQNLEATLHPECRFEDHATGQVWHGLDGAAAHYRQWWATFDVTVKRDAGQIAAWNDDGGYLGEATWRGTHIGPFLGIAPTGRPVVIPFVVVLGFRDGLMLREGFHYDLASLLRQIGDEPIPALSRLGYRAMA